MSISILEFKNDKNRSRATTSYKSKIKAEIATNNNNKFAAKAIHVICSCGK